MNREIKFRIWYKPKNVMIYSDDFPPRLELTFNKIAGWTLWQLRDCKEPKNLSEETTLIFMRDTGLKDKNGKDIYEGDILHIKEFICYSEDEGFEYKDKYAIVEFKNGCFSLTPINIHKLNNQSLDQYEIIGNIYENPELIK